MELTYVKTNSVNLDSIPKVDGQLVSVSENSRRYLDFDGIRQGIATSDEIDAIVNVYGGKNLLPCTATTATSGNVTFTVNSDGSVTVDTGGAAADANRYINVGIPSLKEGDKIILSGCPNDPDLWPGTQIDINGVTGTEQHGEELHLTVTADMVNKPVRVRIAAGQELSNYTFYPMIRDARITDSTYVPYSMTNRQLTERVSDIIGIGTIQEWNGDLNTIGPGMFKVTNPALASNLPNTTNIAWIVFSDAAADGVSTFGFQIAIGYNSGETYIRRLWADWGSWYRLDT